MVAKVKIADIKVGRRHRKDMGNIDELVATIRKVGMLHAVVVTKELQLVAGARRLKAAKKLGWDRVPVHVVNNLTEAKLLLQAERDENTCRKDFLVTEALSLAEVLEPLERKEAAERCKEAGRIGGKGSGNFPDPSKGQARDRIGAAVGMSGKTYEKAKAVATAAKEKPEAFADLVEQMDRTGKVDRVHKELQRRQKREENQKLVEKTKPLPDAVQGKFSTIVIDPAWDWGDEGDVDQFGRGKPTYQTMSIDDLLKFPVGDRAEKNAHIYLWITNRSLPKGFALLKEWDFRYITCITWCKPSIGMGNYYRGSTEQVLFGVRGSLALLRSDIGTWFQADRTGKHSGKPEAFYSMVEECSPGPWLEIFSRSSRAGWAHWGAEAKRC